MAVSLSSRTVLSISPFRLGVLSLKPVLRSSPRSWVLEGQNYCLIGPPWKPGILIQPLRTNRIRIKPLRTNRIRIQLLRTNRIRMHDFCKTETGSGCMVFARPNPDPDPGKKQIRVFKISHLFYDVFLYKKLHFYPFLLRSLVIVMIFKLSSNI